MANPASRILDLRTYAVTAVAVVSFSCYVVHLFGETIPGIVAAFFRYAGEYVALAAIFVFALAWLIRARPHGRPRRYSVVVFDVCGRESAIDGIRTEFKTHDVAWSFMRQYKEAYPLFNFALVSDSDGGGGHGATAEKRTIFRYI